MLIKYRLENDTQPSLMQVCDVCRDEDTNIVYFTCYNELVCDISVEMSKTEYEDVIEELFAKGRADIAEFYRTTTVCPDEDESDC